MKIKSFLWSSTAITTAVIASTLGGCLKSSSKTKTVSLTAGLKPLTLAVMGGQRGGPSSTVRITQLKLGKPVGYLSGGLIKLGVMQTPTVITYGEVAEGADELRIGGDTLVNLIDEGKRTVNASDVMAYWPTTSKDSGTQDPTPQGRLAARRDLDYRQSNFFFAFLGNSNNDPYDDKNTALIPVPELNGLPDKYYAQLATTSDATADGPMLVSGYGQTPDDPQSYLEPIQHSALNIGSFSHPLVGQFPPMLLIASGHSSAPGSDSVPEVYPAEAPNALNSGSAPAPGDLGSPMYDHSGTIIQGPVTDGGYLPIPEGKDVPEGGWSLGADIAKADQQAFIAKAAAAFDDKARRTTGRAAAPVNKDKPNDPRSGGEGGSGGDSAGADGKTPKPR